MKFLGINFFKLSAEKTSNEFKGIKINTDLNIEDIKQSPSPLNTQGNLLIVKFNYKIEYNPSFAKIFLGGNLILSVTEEESSQILKDWKDKTISDNIKTKIINSILNKSNLKALQMEDDLNIPYHLPFPIFKPTNKKQ